ncbi:cell shape determining protein, MreB/Mrl family [Leptospira ellinghausenii]|uniref:Cell shape determining protein, MreB/Mrl family n=1 Tax=Leptospira ellinghausenii TaxID=1917822 RepID=A0A2P2DEG9_9LEPT|nr:cell shape determining protein, MreB/Mrl family [Leptospira ellinghausenii]
MEILFAFAKRLERKARSLIPKQQDNANNSEVPHYLTKETGVPVFRAENPLTCVVLGTGRYLDELKYIKPGIR